MKSRRIIMLLSAYKLPAVQAAVIADQAGAEAPDGFNLIEFCDNFSSDYPALRAALRAAGASYDFYSRRDTDGDHNVWQHGRDGNAEEFSNFGNSERTIKPIRECAF